MTTQLTLVPTAPRTPSAGKGAAGKGSAGKGAAGKGSAGTAPWRLDDRTRAVGLAGVARARAVLAEARRAGDGPHTDEPAAA